MSVVKTDNAIKSAVVALAVICFLAGQGVCVARSAADSTKSQGHTAVDLGEEEFTVGRPHPMINNDLRIRRLLQEARDPETAVIVLDVVLGYGAHPDPAAELGPAVMKAKTGAAQVKLCRHRPVFLR